MTNRMSFGGRHRWKGVSWCSLLLGAALSLGCAAEEESQSAVLVLSPYTGTSAADGFNREQALRLISNRSETSDVAGGKFDFVFFDTGQTAQNTGELESLLAPEALKAIVGPDDPSAFDGGKQGSKILDLLPGIATEEEVKNSGEERLWLGPSAEEMACTLAENVYDFEDYRVAVVHDVLPLHAAMAETIISTTNRYDGFHRSEQITVTLGTSSASQAAAFHRLVDFEPDAIVLLTSTKTAATLIQDWSAAKGSVNWYLGPGLLSDELLENVPMEEMEGAVGIAPGVQTNNQAARRFREAFVSETGAEPFPSTYYYVDAAILAIASMQAAHYSDSPGPEETIRQARLVSSSPGERFTWDELDSALELLRNGEAVDYQGVTGALTVDQTGQIIRVNNFDLTEVKDGAIVPLFQDTCI